MRNLSSAGRRFQLHVFTLADTGKETMRDQAAAIFDLFLERAAEFGVHASVMIDHPDLADTSESRFLADVATYVARQASVYAYLATMTLASAMPQGTRSWRAALSAPSSSFARRAANY